MPKTYWEILNAACAAVARQRKRAAAYARRADANTSWLAEARADVEAIDAFLNHHTTLLGVRLDNEMRRALDDGEIGVVNTYVRVRAKKRNAVLVKIDYLA